MMISLSELLKENEAFLDNKVIVFPTDTVYGLGCKWTDSEAIEKIYEIKKRDGRKPIAVLVSRIEQILPYIEIINPKSLELLFKYWPGQVTFIFKIKSNFNYPTETIAFRMPASSVAKKIIDHFGPLSTTSVNLSGEAPINNVNEINSSFKDQIDLVVSDTEEMSEVSSTIVDLTSNEIKIIRQGSVIINV